MTPIRPGKPKPQPGWHPLPISLSNQPRPAPTIQAGIIKGTNKIAAPKQDMSQDFVRSLGLRWKNPKGSASYLGTIVELQEAFDSNEGDANVWEVSRILGEAHATKLRTGNGLPPQVERQAMTAAYSRAFDELKSELENIGSNPDPFAFVEAPPNRPAIKDPDPF